MNIISDIDTLSESRTTPVWKFLKIVEYKIGRLRKLARKAHHLQINETYFRDMIFPGNTQLSLLGRDFTHEQNKEHKKRVFWNFL